MSQMTGGETREDEGDGSDRPQEGAGSSGFVWDDESQLYFHAGTGFYHDPAAGWYYSWNDGLYYRFEKGAYVPCLESCQHSGDSSRGAAFSPQTASKADVCIDSLGPFDRDNMVEGLEELPPAPSEWLEETLIDLYLAGPSSAYDAMLAIPTCGNPGEGANEHQACRSDLEDMQLHNSTPASDEILVINEQLPKEANESQAPASEDLGEDEENWQAQYGQVVKSDDGPPMPFHAIDLWDWSFVVDPEIHVASSKKKCRKRQVARLVGRLTNTSCKLHPSMSSTSFLKTASISKVHLDLVRVATGKVYRLRNPSSAYLTSLSSYDASNPTKDWDFPEFDICQRTHTSTSAETVVYQDSQPSMKDVHSRNQPAQSHQSATRATVYKDRAALRRALHGGYGIGFEKKDTTYEDETRPFSEAEAANMSIGPGSYARRIMKNMGWKEGQVLGKTNDGLVEPLKVTGNKGYAGLGWNRT